jgi:hypothetical protein
LYKNRWQLPQVITNSNHYHREHNLQTSQVPLLLC